ncbi:MAG: DUF3858 domain-containing protein, partial [Cyclobacteriaceae bacterium]
LEDFQSISNIKTVNYDKKGSVYVVAFDGSTEIEQLGGKLIIKPFLNFPFSETGLSLKERKYPIDFIYAKSFNYKTQINIPDGYQLKKLPENINIQDKLAAISLQYQKNNDQLVINGSYTFFNSTYQPDDYVKVKEFMELIVEAFNKELVFEKI